MSRSTEDLGKPCLRKAKQKFFIRACQRSNQRAEARQHLEDNRLQANFRATAGLSTACSRCSSIRALKFLWPSSRPLGTEPIQLWWRCSLCPDSCLLAARGLSLQPASPAGRLQSCRLTAEDRLSFQVTFPACRAWHRSQQLETFSIGSTATFPSVRKVVCYSRGVPVSAASSALR